MKLFVVALGFSLIALTTGCSKGSGSYSVLPTGQTFNQGNSALNNQIDILWVVDNSKSMYVYQNNLATNFASFINNIQNQGYDLHMAVTTSDTYLADTALSGYNPQNSSLAKFRDGTNFTSHTGIFDILSSTPNLTSVFSINALQGIYGNSDQRGLESLKVALNSNLNLGFLRTNSFLAIIVLSGNDDFSGAARAANAGTLHDESAATLDSTESYISYLDTLTASTGASRRYNISTIGILDQTCLQTQSSFFDASIATRYMSITTETNGVQGSLCDANFANSLVAIGTRIAELSSQFFLNRQPLVDTLLVNVNGQVVLNDATNGWTYNSLANSIVFHGSSIPMQNAVINVDFTPATLTGN